MKKFLAVLFMILLTSTQSVFAYQEIRFNNAGVPFNGPNSPSARFGKNAAVGSPARRAYEQAHQRHYIKRPAMTHNCRKQYMQCGKCPCPNNIGHAPAQATSSSIASNTAVSRFNKNYETKAPKSYTKNGITFYN